MRRRAGQVYPLLYPLLFAASLVLWIAGRNAGQYRGSDLGVVLAAAILLAALAVGSALVAVRAFDPRDRGAPLAAALAMLAVAWFYFYVLAQDALSEVSWRFSRDRVLVPLGLIATLGATAWLLHQSRERLLGVSALMTRFGVLLVGIVLVQALIAQGRGPSAPTGSGLVRELAKPVRTLGPPPPGRNTPARDIYLIVLDGHASVRTLEELFKYDSTPFVDSLRALGFVVPRDVRSNYPLTVLSMPSLLNSAHVTRLAQDAGVMSRDYSLPKYLVENNRVARFLKRQGYKYVLFPSEWWGITERSPIADEEFDARPEFRLSNELRRTELRRAILRSSLLRNLVRPERGDARFYRRSFEGLAALPADSAPTFAFAHVLLPHLPYFFDERCRPLERPITDAMEADTPEQRTAYLRQLRCVDGLVLGLVTKLLRRSPTPPVIVLVADHGSRFTDVRFYDRPDRVSAAFLRERFGVFGAFHLPAGGDSVFRKPVTLVNVLGNVLRYYFNADLPPSRDDMYVSGVRPYRFYPVNARQYSER